MLLLSGESLEEATMSAADPLLAPLKADQHREVGGVLVDIAKAGNVRVKRMIYPPGFNWDKDLKAVVEYKAPQFVAVEPGHQGWVVGDEPAVLIEFDFEGDTVNRLGVPAHHHS